MATKTLLTTAEGRLTSIDAATPPDQAMRAVVREMRGTLAVALDAASSLAGELTAEPDLETVYRDLLRVIARLQSLGHDADELEAIAEHVAEQAA